MSSQNICPGCRLKLEDIKSSGKVGCSHCYDSFSHFLIPLISKVQGKIMHVGKKPVRLSDDIQDQIEVDALRKKLSSLVEEEAYEEAALLRDKIKFLEKRIRSRREPVAIEAPKKKRGRPKKITKDPDV